MRPWNAAGCVILLYVGASSACRTGGPSGPPTPGAPGVAAEAQEGRLTGAWRVVETAARSAGSPWASRPVLQGGLYVFSERHYSYFYVRGDHPRPRFRDANRPTEAERAATFETFIAGAGRYTLEGRTLRMQADFRKNPNEMSGETWSYLLEFRGDTAWLVMPEPPFLPGQEWRVTLVRTE